MNFPLDTFRQLDTPFYAYSISLLRRTLTAATQSIAGANNRKIHYAVKANNDSILLKEIASAGLGADCVSVGEIEWAIKNGFKPADIVYAGVGKTDREIRRSIEVGIGCFNVESEPELDNINHIALSMGTKADVALRVNPDIDAHTHPNITTGTYEDQFGIPLVQIDGIISKALAMQGINLKGLHFHIGSQITDMSPFGLLCEKINSLLDKWEKDGITFKWINVGGGLGIDYDTPDLNPIPDFEAYFKTFDALRLRPAQELHFELGRAIVAQCGSLITRVIYIKEGVGKTFAITDAGFNDLIRPALYDAHHKIDVLDSTSATLKKYDVVGPICESTDCFAHNVELPELHRGSLLALRSAGAYGQSMASTYNMRPLPDAFYME